MVWHLKLSIIITLLVFLPSTSVSQNENLSENKVDTDYKILQLNLGKNGTLTYMESNSTKTIVLNITTNVYNEIKNLQNCRSEDTLCDVIPLLTKIIELLSKENGDSWNNISTLFTAIVPSATGAVVTLIVTRSWQIRSAKIQMKKEVLEIFSKSAYSQYVIIHQLIGKIFTQYGRYAPEEYDEKEGISHVKFAWPKNENELPSIVFREEMKKMQERLDDSKHIHEPLFISLLHLYYRNDKLLDEYKKISINIGKLKNYIYTIVDSKNKEDFVLNYNNYYTKHRQTRKQLNDFRRKLIFGEIIIHVNEKSQNDFTTKNLNSDKNSV